MMVDGNMQMTSLWMGCDGLWMTWNALVWVSLFDGKVVLC